VLFDVVEELQRDLPPWIGYVDLHAACSGTGVGFIIGQLYALKGCIESDSPNGERADVIMVYNAPNEDVYSVLKLLGAKEYTMPPVVEPVTSGIGV